MSDERAMIPSEETTAGCVAQSSEGGERRPECNLVIPGELPAMNEIIAEAKSHFGAYSSMKRQYTNTVALLAKAKRLPRVDRAVVRCTWYAPNRRKDPDNIEAGVKFILDGLVMAGVLPNDGWRHVAGIEHEFRVDAKWPRVVVDIVAAEEESA